MHPSKTVQTPFRDVADRRSAITLLKTCKSTKRALIQTRRGEIDYGKHDRHGFAKSMVRKMTSTRIRHNSPKTYKSTKRALIQTRRGEIDYGEHDKHVYAKSMFWKMSFDIIDKERLTTQIFDKDKDKDKEKDKEKDKDKEKEKDKEKNNVMLLS